MTLCDPGNGLPRAEARAARIAAWPRPATVDERRGARESRKRTWLRRIANGRKSAAAGHFLVTAGGSPAGDGSIDRPWNLATALVSDSVRPGDTIWLAGGRYEGIFRSALRGEPQNKVAVRALPGARVVIDGGVRVETGGHIVFRDLEILNSRLKRRSEIPGSEPADIDPNDGFHVAAPYVKLVNNFIHDAPQGIGIWGTAIGSEVYGNIVYNNGWTGPDRTHGHGIYVQNSDATQPKRIEHNVFSNNYSFNVHGYGSSASSLRGFVFEENVSMNRRWLIGGDASAAAVSVRGNHVFRGSFEIGYGAAENADVQIISNTIVDAPVVFKRWNSFRVEDNVVAASETNGLSVEFRTSSMGSAAEKRWDGTKYVSLPPAGRRQFSVDGTLLAGFKSWVASTGFDLNGQVQETAPGGPWIFVLPNKYESGRALIAVYNWNLASEVAVDLAPVIEKGDRYTISNCLNRAESLGGIWLDGPVKVPMTGWIPTRPLNDEQATDDSTLPRFGVFLLTTARGSANEYANDLIPRPRNDD